MKKITFDLSFLDEENNDKNSRPSYLIISNSNKNKLNQTFIWFVRIVIGITIVLFFSWHIYQDWKTEKIEKLTQLALQYKEEKNQDLINIIAKLATLKHQHTTVITQQLNDLFNKKRDLNIQQLVKTSIENETIDDNFERSFLKCLDVYFDGDKKSYLELYNAEFSRQKENTLHKVVSMWISSPIIFELNKKKYVKTLFNGNVKQFNEELDSILGYKHFTLVEQSLPQSGVIKNYADTEAIAPFKITTRKYSDKTGDNYYIKLIDAKTQKLAITIFVQAGDTIELDIPLGIYQIRYASGKKWYGEQDFFGHFTSYNESEELLDFVVEGNRIKGHSIVLYKVANGNFETHSINAENF